MTGYVTEVATLKTDKKTSKMGALLIVSCLGGCPRIESLAEKPDLT
jgi:hypothetical protein